MLKHLFILLILTTLTLSAVAQNDIPLGTWRTHFSYYNIKHITSSGEKIYAAAENGLYFFDKDDNSITRISKIDGLQSEDVSALFYDNQSDQLLIGYANGNLDVVRGAEIFNLNLTRTSQVTGSKRINHILSYQDWAFLSTDYGVLRLNLDELVVDETYRELGAGATTLQVNQGTIYKDSLFLATEEGVIASSLTADINLLDYRNWYRFDAVLPASPVQIITSAADGLLAGYSQDQLYTYDGQWDATGLFSGVDFQDATSTGEIVVVTYDGKGSRIDAQLEVTNINAELSTYINTAIVDDSGVLWIGDRVNGLVSNYSGQFQVVGPDGPYSSEVFQLVEAASSIYAFPGGYTANFDPLGDTSGFHKYSNGRWINYNEAGISQQIPAFQDIVDGDYVNEHEAFYAASASDGLLKVANDGTTQIYNSSNSPLKQMASGENVIIPAVTSSAGALWVLNYGTSTPLHKLAVDNNWTSYSFGITAAQFPTDVMIVRDAVWLIIDPEAGGGIYVFRPSDGSQRLLSDVGGNGGLASSDVNCFTLDKEGFVWVGTDNGVSVFTFPEGVLEGQVEAVEPIYEGRQLFKGERVLSIQVDGGNRKWISTDEGVWLFDDEADEEILFFNTENSPLPDNLVRDIAINPESGEVFFATASGIVSYRASATEADGQHNNVKIFPNPVTADFQGTVGISGLASDAIIKITDVSGKLVWQEQANGGTATWSVTDYNGSRAQTGIYLVFSSTEDGEDTFVGKIAVIN